MRARRRRHGRYNECAGEVFVEERVKTNKLECRDILRKNFFAQFLLVLGNLAFCDKVYCATENFRKFREMVAAKRAEEIARTLSWWCSVARTWLLETDDVAEEPSGEVLPYGPTGFTEGFGGTPLYVFGGIHNCINDGGVFGPGRVLFG